MSEMILKVLKDLDTAVGDTTNKLEKRSIAQIEALIAIAEELERANQLKEAELRKLYGSDFV